MLPDYTCPRRWETPSNSKACRWTGVGVVMTVKGGRPPTGWMRLAVMVARSSSMVAKLCAGPPPAAALVAVLASADPRLGDHPPVPHDRDMSQAEPLLELGDLAGQGGRIASVALEHLHRHRDPLGGGEHPVDDLQPSPHAVAGMPDLTQRAGAALERR